MSAEERAHGVAAKQADAGTNASIDVTQNPTRVAFLLFLFFSAFYAMTSSGRVRSMDEYMAYYQTESLVLRQSLAVPQAVYFRNFYGRYDRFQQPRAPYPPGQALVAAPFYALGMTAVSAMKLPLEPAMFLLEFAACLSSAIVSAATVSVLFLLLCNLGFSYRTALATSFLAAITTMLWPYAGYFFSEPLTCLLTALSALFLFSTPDAEEEPLSLRTLVIAGVLLGSLVWVRPTHLLVALVFCVALLVSKKRMGPAAIVAGVVALSLAMYIAYNHYLFGGFLRSGYPDFAEGGRRLNSFSTPAYLGLAGQLFSPGKSVFLYMPMIVPGLLGLRRMWQRNRGIAVVAAALPLAYLLFFMKLTNWEGGHSPGPRYLLPATLLLCGAAAPLLEDSAKWKRMVLWIAVISGLFVQVVSIATSFLEAQVGHGYYEASFNYRFSYSQLVAQLNLLMHYGMGATPPQAGMGWDRWFIFLRATGTPSAFVTVLLAIECLAVSGFGWLLLRQYQSCKLGAIVDADTPS